MKRGPPDGGAARKICVAAVFAFLSACASDVYEGEVQSFASGVSTLNTSFETLIKQEDDAYFSRELEKIKTDKPSLRLGDGQSECATLEILLETGDDNAFKDLLGRCGLYYQFDGNRIEPIHPRAQVDNARKLIRAMDSYAGNLAELAAAQDIDTLDSAAARLRDSVASLTGTANQVAQASLPLATPALLGITQTVTMGGKFVLWVFSEYHRHVRFQRFKSAVIAADDAIAQTRAPLGDILSALNRNLIRHQMDRLTAATLGPAQSRSDIESAQREHDALLSLAAFDGPALAENLVKTHHALKEAVSDPTRQKDSLIAFLKAFKDHVNELSDAMDKVSKGN